MENSKNRIKQLMFEFIRKEEGRLIKIDSMELGDADCEYGTIGNYYVVKCIILKRNHYLSPI